MEGKRNGERDREMETERQRERERMCLFVCVRCDVCMYVRVAKAHQS